MREEAASLQQQQLAFSTHHACRGLRLALGRGRSALRVVDALNAAVGGRAGADFGCRAVVARVAAGDGTTNAGAGALAAGATVFRGQAFHTLVDGVAVIASCAILVHDAPLHAMSSGCEHILHSNPSRLELRCLPGAVADAG